MAHGVFVDGVWHTEWYNTAGGGGRFVPAEPVFRNWVTPDGSAGPSGHGGFAAERGRYHLYVSLACPYAHRTVIFRKLKDLESVISMSVVDPVMGDEGTGLYVKAAVAEAVATLLAPCADVVAPNAWGTASGATTIRQQLDKHRSNASGATCHSKIDPAGFALESFDVLGGWRDRYRGVDETVPAVNPISKLLSHRL